MLLTHLAISYPMSHHGNSEHARATAVAAALEALAVLQLAAGPRTRLAESTGHLGESSDSGLRRLSVNIPRSLLTHAIAHGQCKLRNK